MFNNVWLLLELYSITLIFYPFYKFFLSSKYYITINCLVLFFLIVVYLSFFFDIIFSNLSLNILFSTNNVYTGDFNLYLVITPIGFFFSFLVIVIGFTTNIYTLNYFNSEAAELKFLWILNTFIISMLFLVLSHNFFSLFIGWEMIGLTSYFLINFWKEHTTTMKSSSKAFNFNLVSDIFLVASIVCFYIASNSLDFNSFYIFVSNIQKNDYCYTLFFGFFFILLSSIIKSVQIIGHLWLPDSMEAPVPASSLIHSATLVSAGIYLLCKFKFLIVFFNFEVYLSIIGAVTAAYGGLTAASQTDLKKLLAYSTMSHCGFLWFLASFHSAYLTILYLYLHGFFKASTFYCAGSFIKVFGSQDSRYMGSGHIIMRLESFLLLFCSSNLAGLPFTIGYFYKFFFVQFFITTKINILSIGLLTIGLLSSLVYFYRLSFYTIFDFQKNINSINHFSLDIVEHSFIIEYRQASFNHIISIFIIFLFSIFCCYFFYYCMCSSLIAFDFWVYSEGATNTNLDSLTVYNSYFILFYCFYIIIFIFIFIISWKKNLFYIESNFIILYFLLLGLLLICEVILWRMLMQLLTLILVFLLINLIF